VALLVFVGAGLAACTSATAISQASDSPMPIPGQSGAPLPPPRVSRASGSPVPVATESATMPSHLTVGEVDIVARDLAFTPTRLDIPAIGSTRIVLRNDGFVVHNLTVDELAIQVVVSRGGVGEVTLVDPPPGTYPFYCSVSGHREAGMVGTLVVE
jgi:uncharacterized cupredoxin-like copper-binding protein